VRTVACSADTSGTGSPRNAAAVWWLKAAPSGSTSRAPMHRTANDSGTDASTYTS
jgi:hypothetical protein